MMTHDLLIGIDAGTSAIKAAAFDTDGREVATASVRNRFMTSPDGAATQSPDETWTLVAQTVQRLRDEIADLGARTLAIGITAHGDGTWMIDSADAPVGDAWLWLDSRAAAIADELRAGAGEAARFAATGTGLTGCQQGPQLVWMKRNAPELLARARTVFHCKDWLYFRMTGHRATDPCEASFSFGNFRTRSYDADAMAPFCVPGLERLLPPIVDGSRQTHPLLPAAARDLGLTPGTPVSLGFLDAVCTALGAGVWDPAQACGCTVWGSTAVHMRAQNASEVRLDAVEGGYVLVLPVPGQVAMMQTNMAGTLNLDWLLDMAADLVVDLGHPRPDQGALLARCDDWLTTACGEPILYQPYISEAGERGPFVNPMARAGFVGLDRRHRFADLVSAVITGLSLAARDCFAAMGGVPVELRLTGGAARSAILRQVLANALQTRVCPTRREEAGTGGVAMIAAMALGVHANWEDCIRVWVHPHLDTPVSPDPAQARTAAEKFAVFRALRHATTPVWEQMAELRRHY